MANAVVTSNAITIKTEFNDFAPVVGYTVGYYGRDKIEAVRVDNKSDTVQVFLTSSKTYVISTNGQAESLPIDSVNGVAPTSTIHLAEMISDLIL